MVQLLKEKEAAKILACSQETLRSWRKRKQGPPYVKNGRSVRYRSDALSAYILANEVPAGDPEAQKEEGG